MKATNAVDHGKSPSNARQASGDEPHRHLEAGGSIDGCRDAVPLEPSLAQKARLDLRNRAVVVTSRFGQTLVMQRIALNAYTGVAAHLVASQEQPQSPDASSVRLVLRHELANYTIALEDQLALEEAVAVWRQWADRLSVPMLLSEEGNTDSVVRAMLGPVHIRAAQPRRKQPLVGRRPRFSKRRGLR